MSFWDVVTRLGEAQILLPALLAVALWLALRSNAHRTASHWLALVAVASAVTTVTKVAFLGFGIGIAELDFTGISGHSMFAAAVLPLLAHAVAHDTAWQRRALGMAYTLALLIGVSRVEIGVHSWSEVLSGLTLGTLARTAALAWAAVPHRPMPKPVLVGLFAWLLAAPAGTPPSPTHGWVIRASLAVSGRTEPFTREMLRQRLLPQVVHSQDNAGPTPVFLTPTQTGLGAAGPWGRSESP
jgi:membrane-associated phospholipid phosphatase